MEIQSFEDLLYYKVIASKARQKMTVYVFVIDGLLIDTGPSQMREELISLYDQ